MRNILKNLLLSRLFLWMGWLSGALIVGTAVAQRDDINNDLDEDEILNTGISQMFALDGAQPERSFTINQDTRYAQTFTSNIDGSITAVELPISCAESAVLTIEIREVRSSDGDPRKTDSEYSVAINTHTGFNGQPEAFARLDLTKPDPHTVLSNDTLAIVASATGGVCSWYNVAGFNFRTTIETIATYSGGGAFTSSNNGEWVANAYGGFGLDLPFAIIMRPPSVLDNCPNTPNNKQADINTNGIGDACEDGEDSDNDNDGLLNEDDNCEGTKSSDPSDTDTDGKGDACDTDIDGDGFLNDLDGGEDDDNCRTIANPDQIDTDTDGEGDACDTDIDGDSFLNAVDKCPLINGDDQSNDTDGDGIGDVCDNCPMDENLDQADANNNGKGDICDDGDFCFPVIGSQSMAVICL